MAVLSFFLLTFVLVNQAFFLACLVIVGRMPDIVYEKYKGSSTKDLFSSSFLKIFSYKNSLIRQKYMLREGVWHAPEMSSQFIYFL